MRGGGDGEEDFFTDLLFMSSNYSRLLSDAIHRHILDPAGLPGALRNLRGDMFPHNAQGTPTLSPPSSDHELRALRRKCAGAWEALVPRAVGRLYFGGRATSWLAAWWSGSGGNTTNDGDNNGGTTGAGVASDEDLDARIVTEIESDILDVFGDAYCNKHLMYGALELILVRLIPELAEKGVMELWEERLS